MISAGEIKAFSESISIPVTGVCDAETSGLFSAFLNERRKHFPACRFEEEDIEKRVNPKLLMPESKSVIVCLFPYHISGQDESNVSCYARIPDYHEVVREKLGKLEAYIKNHEPEAKCMQLCDTSPLMDRMLAFCAGVGFFGKNNLLIHPVFGSYVFIGSLLTNLILEPDKPMEKGCDNCGACIRSCPGGALSDGFGFNCERCISYLTQIKDLSEEQKNLLSGQKSVYGCDVCQRVCPHNQNVPDTPIQAFYEASLDGLSADELSSLSNRAFKKEYAQFPFSWCSRDTILKNFGAIGKED